MVMAHVQSEYAITDALSIYCIVHMEKLTSLKESDY